jgi:hypothetical protein
MNRLIVGALVLLAAVGQVSIATAQTSAPPPPTSAPPPPTPPNLQGLPWWFVKHQYMPGMPWFHRAPAWPSARQCRVAYWYQAQMWNTDQWGKTVTWVDYVPQYVCD